MDIIRMVDESKKVLEFVDTLGLKADEKIVVLKVSASVIENIIAAESLSAMMLNYLKGSVR